MAIEISIKPKFKSTRVAFGKSAKPLGVRDDLLELAIIARSSNNQSLLNYFEKLPSLEELKKEQLEDKLSQSGVSFKRPVEVIQKQPEVTQDKDKEPDPSEVEITNVNPKSKSSQSGK